MVTGGWVIYRRTWPVVRAIATSATGYPRETKSCYKLFLGVIRHSIKFADKTLLTILLYIYFCDCGLGETTKHAL